MLSDAIPNGLNELDALFDAKAKDLLELGWTHVSNFTLVVRRMQSVRITFDFSCVLDWRGPCASTERDRPDRQL